MGAGKSNDRWHAVTKYTPRAKVRTPIFRVSRDIIKEFWVLVPKTSQSFEV